MMFVLATVAVASPPPTNCPPSSGGQPTRTVEFTLVGRSYGPGHLHVLNGVDVPIEPGAALAQSVDAALDLLRPMMGDRLPVIDRGSAAEPGARYLVVWWREPHYRYPVVETVWVRPAETLVSLLSSPRERDRKPRAEETAVANAVQVFRLPPGEYPPAGIVFTEVQWPADE